MTLLIPQTASQRVWPLVGDIDDCWILAWMTCQIAVAPWLPWLDTTTARRFAGDPDDGVSDGNDRGLYDMLRGIQAATPELYPLVRKIERMRWPDLLPLIKAGRPFAAAVMGGALPKPYTTVPHQGVLFHEPNVGLRWADPLAPDRSEPYRISTPGAGSAMGAFAGAGLCTGVLFPTIAEAFPTHPLYADPGGYTQAQLDAAVAAAEAPLNNRIRTIKGKVAALAADVADD